MPINPERIQVVWTLACLGHVVVGYPWWSNPQAFPAKGVDGHPNSWTILAIYVANNRYYQLSLTTIHYYSHFWGCEQQRVSGIDPQPCWMPASWWDRPMLRPRGHPRSLEIWLGTPVLRLRTATVQWFKRLGEGLSIMIIVIPNSLQDSNP